MRGRALLLASAATAVLAGRSEFNVYDDILAFPQYAVYFPEEYVLEPDADARLTQGASLSSSKAQATSSVLSVISSASPPAPTYDPDRQISDRELAQHLLKQERSRHSNDGTDASRQNDEAIPEYEEMVLSGARFLCEIPRDDVGTVAGGHGGEGAANSKTDHEKELARATDRGLELLQEMEGKCMYYGSGWWSYSFCYQDQVKQFHALPPGNGAPMYPPTEDPTAHSFVLGKFKAADRKKKGGDDHTQSSAKNAKPTTAVATLQTQGDSRYLVQNLGGGTRCDLTGRERRIEVQFHCHPQSTDRIGWIKEVTTCSYLMVIYTPRLCNDVAFLPPHEDEAQAITCKEIITEAEVPEWEAMKRSADSQLLVNAALELEQFPLVGDIEVGAMKLVGQEGKRIEKGQVVSPIEEKVEVVARSEDGRVSKLSREELKKYNLDPEKIETLRQRLEELAQGKDWKLEVVEAGGERGLRGIVDAEEEEEEEQGSEEEQKGSPKDARNEADTTEKADKPKLPSEDKPRREPARERPPEQVQEPDEPSAAPEGRDSDETYHEEL